MKWSIRNTFVNELINDSFEPIEPIHINESKNNSDLIFQGFDWYSEDIINEETNYPEYKVFIFGILDSGLPISIRVDDFYPFFFIEVHVTSICICREVCRPVFDPKRLL
jgi:hypothetical protein